MAMTAKLMTAKPIFRKFDNFDSFLYNKDITLLSSLRVTEGLHPYEIVGV